MKKNLSPLLLLLAVCVCPAIPAFADARTPESDERIAASFVLALGRAPSASEMETWSKQPSLSLSDLMGRHRQHLQSDPALNRAAIIKAGEDAFGRTPTEDDVATSGNGSIADTYTAVVQRHIATLASQPDRYVQVIQRAYREVVRRDAYPEEVAYWQTRPTHSFVVLLACIDDWARRNQPGLMVTSGMPTASIHCGFLTTVRLSPALADEARVFLGLDQGNADLAAASGRTLMAAGAADVVSGGRIAFTAAGAALRPLGN